MFNKSTRKRSGSVIVQPRKGAIFQTPAKKPAISPIDSSSSFDGESDKQPISDFPIPPYQIVSCRHTQAGSLTPLPHLNTAPAGEIPQLAYSKIKQCMRICNFSDAKDDVVSKETKKGALNELIDIYSNQKLNKRLSRECHSLLIEMFATNVFRPLPNIPSAVLLSDDITFEDSAWPHLSLVYILFQKFLEANIDQRILQFQLTPRYITQLFAVLAFPDEREREQAKIVISMIFDKVPAQRRLLNKIATNFLAGIPEGISMNATGHLLELFYLFTAGTPLPLKQSLVLDFIGVILPLHLLSRFQYYHQQLVRCVMLMIRKDAKLCPILLKFLISHWPLTHDHKSELFIDEVSQVIEETNDEDVTVIIPSLLERISFAAESSSMALSEKALGFLRKNRVKVAIKNDPSLINMIFPTLFIVARDHWSKNVQLSALQVMRSLMDLNPEFMKKAALDFKHDMTAEPIKKEAKRRLWEKIADIAMRNDSRINKDTVRRDMNAYFGTTQEEP